VTQMEIAVQKAIALLLKERATVRNDASQFSIALVGQTIEIAAAKGAQILGKSIGVECASASIVAFLCQINPMTLQ